MAEVEQDADRHEEEVEAEVQRRFDARLPALVQQVAQQLRAEFAGTVSSAPPSGGSMDTTMIEALAHAIVTAGDPTNSRRAVSPEVAKAREEARTRMMDLLAHAKATEQMPSYYLTRKVYLKEMKLDHQYQDPVTKAMRPVRINWPGIPNDAMAPANDIARQIHAEYIASMSYGDGGRHLPIASKWVINGREMLRERPGAAPEVTQPGDLEDIRVPGHSDLRQERTINILGTVAEPGKIGFDHRMQ